ncbi:unnamed protein product [Effrenium voratum]|nr:unnamed protein product [Effrenium voratum]
MLVPTAENATPPSPSSARSFATCISARSTRSTSITPRSRRPSFSSEVGSRNTSKSRNLPPLARKVSGTSLDARHGFSR